MLRVHTKVKIIDTPYNSVPNGTVTRITGVRPYGSARGQHIYELGHLPHKLFPWHTIRPYRGRKKPIEDTK